MDQCNRPNATEELRSLFSLEEKVVAITGAGGELCGAIARTLGSLGVRVAVVDRSEPAAESTTSDIRAAGGDSLALATDVLSTRELEDARDRIIARWGRCDALINGAGGNRPEGTTDVLYANEARREAGSSPNGAGETASDEARSFFELKESGFRSTLDLNLLGTVLPSQIIGKAVRDSGGGTILNIASMTALNPLTKVVAYSAAKSGVASLTKWLAVHLSKSNIRVNALAPGFFLTEQLRFLHIDSDTGEYTPRAKTILAHTPLGRYGMPDDLLGATVWLLSDSASFVTGSIVTIDGGFSVATI